MNYNKNALLRLARDSIRTKFLNEEPRLTDEQKKYRSPQGVFITLKKNGQLRGCIGFPYPIMPLNQAIIQASRAAAFEDPRFPSLAQTELSDIKIEISILTTPKEITGKKEELPNQIEIGKDGLIIKHPESSGLLLPQVFTEYNCTQEQALEMVCQKAGLNPKAWKDKDAKIFKFQAVIFEE
ncbi:TIGR00296 family protein [Candidatus Woesearchaeota archaeon]|nr:MAG: TIGR00296 family protein [Candidatus Woesearchaeota archaeon]